MRESPDDSAAVLELPAARVKLAWTTASLAEAARLLDTIGVSTSEYRQLLIRATGSLTQDIFDPEVARGLIDEAVDDASEWAKDNGATAAFQLLLFVLIVAVSRALGSFTRRVITRVAKIESAVEPRFHAHFVAAIGRSHSIAASPSLTGADTLPEPTGPTAGPAGNDSKRRRRRRGGP